MRGWGPPSKVELRGGGSTTSHFWMRKLLEGFWAYMVDKFEVGMEG